MDQKTILDIAAGIVTVPSVLIIVQVAKMTGLPSQFAPATAIVVGIGLYLATSLVTGMQPAVAGILGLSLGLSAAGVYSGFKATLKKP